MTHALADSKAFFAKWLSRTKSVYVHPLTGEKRIPRETLYQLEEILTE